MAQTVTVQIDGRCGSCNAKGDVLVVRQGDDTQGWVSRFCNPCLRKMVELAERAVDEFYNRTRRWPKVVPFEETV